MICDNGDACERRQTDRQTDVDDHQAAKQEGGRVGGRIYIFPAKSDFVFFWYKVLNYTSEMPTLLVGAG